MTADEPAADPAPEAAPESAPKTAADQAPKAAPESAPEAAPEQPSAAVPRVLVLEHDPVDPPMRLGEWLAEAGADLHVARLHGGDEVPADASGWDAVVSLGGSMGARDDEVAPWLPATRALLASAVSTGVPTLGVCLGAQLLAVATGGAVQRGSDGPEIGAYLTAKRDAAEADPLFGGLPLSPDVMHCHDDVITALPPGGELLLSSIGYPIQAFRVGSAAWGVQFHLEATAEVLRGWVAERLAAATESAGGHGDSDAPADQAPPLPRRCGPMLDEAEELMGEVWRAFAHRFVELARDGVPQTPTGRPGPRLTLLPPGPG